ncbi:MULTISPECIES: polysaccharide deacetylase family protein [Protofrankia]|uniref:Polysaccharide deacetylase n=1 Tax=Candidatus Protofrankia datiscae TaxID=2716812 RepID=F8AWC5_9ACTN|nr:MULTISPECIES: polysaccharide deacetylase family protein [Protofrankia]AEH08326.1 polysaccharide deacetylase [Candidatus Protofrankia datiscae]
MTDGFPVLPVLMFHSIGDGASAAFRRWQVPPALFAEQLACLSAAGYQLLGLSEALSRPAGKHIAITFDDAFADFSTHAVPVLRQANAGATLYAPTAYVGGRATWLSAYPEGASPLLTWSDLRDLHAAGYEIDSHGHRHTDLDLLAGPELRHDVETSRHLLEDELSSPVQSFCYPFGYHTRAVREAVAETGFASACEVGYRIHRRDTSPFSISRLIVTGSTSPEQTLALVRSGQPGVVPYLRRGTRAPWRVFRAVRRGLRTRQEPAAQEQP